MNKLSSQLYLSLHLATNNNYLHIIGHFDLIFVTYCHGQQNYMHTASCMVNICHEHPSDIKMVKITLATVSP